MQIKGVGLNWCAMTTAKNLNDQLFSLKDSHVLCVGDMILDQFVYGQADRISPEAPVPVLSIKSRFYTLGGVGNVVANIAAMGASATVIAIVGNDASAQKVEEMLAQHPNLTNATLTANHRPTSFKTRYIAGTQQILRVDDEDKTPISRDIEDQICEKIATAIEDAKVVVISDYGKGVVTDRVIRTVINAAGRRDIPVLVDPKGTDYTRYTGADIITPNRAELAAATNGMPTNTDAEIEAAARTLMDKTAIPTVIATRSADGVSILHESHPPIHMPTHARDVFDVSGAGDTFVACMAAGVGAGIDVPSAVELSNIAAGLAVEKLGTAIVTADDIRAYSDRKGLYSTILTQAQAKEQVARWRARGLEVGFTNGCFDILHQGHVMMLDACRKSCDRLIVGVNVDASVRRLKGESRPVNEQNARALVIAGLASVDGVVLFGEDPAENDTPIALMQALRPDVIFKGQDYTVETVVGADMVQAYGGRVELVPLQEGFSTTATIKKISA